MNHLFSQQTSIFTTCIDCILPNYQMAMKSNNTLSSETGKKKKLFRDLEKTYLRSLSYFSSIQTNKITVVQIKHDLQFNHSSVVALKLNPTKQLVKTTIGKQVAEKALLVDKSWSFGVYETLNLDVSYRWNDSKGSLLGSKQLKSQAFTNYQ